MLCERCKKNTATVFYEEMINGESHSYSLCQGCATEMKKSGELSGFFPFSGFGSMHDQLFGGLFGSVDPLEKTRKVCTLCASSFADLKKNGKVGCPQCYKTFGDELRATIHSIHGNVRHLGRAPSKFRKSREKENELKALKKQLKEAVSSENFEEAATLRDKIRSMEKDI